MHDAIETPELMVQSLSLFQSSRFALSRSRGSHSLPLMLHPWLPSNCTFGARNNERLFFEIGADSLRLFGDSILWLRSINMKILLYTTALLLLVASVKNSAEAKEWRGLTPLHSTRADVIRLLNQCSNQREACRFSLEGEKLFSTTIRTCMLMDLRV